MQRLLSILFCLILSFQSPLCGQNLIVNPDGELPPAANGWVEAAGTWWASMQVAPHKGTQHFYAGTPVPNTVGTVAELYQDVNVSASAGTIDAGLSSYTFTGWMRIFSSDFFGTNDEGRIIVEYRNAASTVLSSYNTGLNTTLVWTKYTDTRAAPVGTRTIRIRLISTMLRATDNDGYMDDLSLVSNVTAPVTLIDFKADQILNSVYLTWSTASEKNNDHFTVERSADGIHWEALSDIPGAGNSSTILNYETSDVHPLTGLSYYRLKQTDFDGSLNYSKVISMNISDNSDIYIYPNPASGTLNVKLKNNDRAQVSFLTMKGESISLSNTEKDGIFHFDLSPLMPGLYLIRIQQSASVHIEKLVIE